MEGLRYVIADTFSRFLRQNDTSVVVVGRLYSVQYKGIFGAPDKGQTLLVRKPDHLGWISKETRKYGHKDFPRHRLIAGLSVPA